MLQPKHCYICGEEIQLSLPYSNDYIRYQSKWYCVDCFSKSVSKKVLANDWLGKTKKYVEDTVSKDEIDTFFKTHYNISLIPSYIYIRLESIYKGTYKGLAQPISPYELLDILLQKEEYLDKCIRKKGISGTSAINYVIAVACGMYSSYREWKNQLAAEQAEAERQRANSNVSKAFRLRGYAPPSERENYYVGDNDFDD